ncbi:hypothetical protein EDD18DRAFT_1107388 [Armillaria luteobubalina]|uniref:Uncharacterized protein n=1 Tax=Armillaria luteobubalina TaxID=153913 RepID=A0AA39ULK4_9AGAR|nr:hypothetical protein EDD18DRAFT_1107388 [Armillaria luteobubalina]
MTTRSKERGAQTIEAPNDPQHQLQSSSSGNNSNQRQSAGPATEKKLPATDPEWCILREVTMETAPANIVEPEPSSNLGRLIPIPEEENVGGEFDVAEFESNRASSLEDNESDDQTVEPKIVDGYSGIDEINQSDHDDEDRVSQSSDNEFDDAILANDKLAYDLAHDSNGPWTDLTEDE